MTDTTTPDLWLTHDGVALGPLRADLAKTYWRWENSLPFMAGYGRQTRTNQLSQHRSPAGSGPAGLLVCVVARSSPR